MSGASGPLVHPQQATRFRVAQRLSLLANRYDISVADGSGRPVGPPVAFAQQKRMALRESVTLYTDESAREVLCRFAARQVFDVRATYDVYDGAGAPLGSFRKEFGASLLRTTFVLEQPGAPQVRGQERSLLLALFQRFGPEIPVPLPVHFDFRAGDDVVMSVERAFSVRDAYDLRVPVPWLDRRLAFAMAVGLEALLGR